MPFAPPPLPQSSRQVSTLTDPPTGADNPDYENITLAFRNQDQPKGSHLPPKNQSKQPPARTHHTALGGAHGRASWEQGSPRGGRGQWCGAWWHVCYSRGQGGRWLASQVVMMMVVVVLVEVLVKVWVMVMVRR